MVNKASPQLLLGFGFSKEHSFNNFLSPSDSSITDRLMHLVFNDAAQFVYLVGGKDSGKTHLCIASFNEAIDRGVNAYYVCCRDLIDTMSGADFATYLDYLQGYELLVLDGIEAFQGDEAFELALFSIYNYFISAQKQLLVSARDVPLHLNFKLPDLVSRLSSGVTQSVEALSEQEKRAAFCRYASERGITLGEELLNYIFARSSRNLGALLAVLDQLDHAQLVEQRSLTVPFVKKVLGW